MPLSLTAHSIATLNAFNPGLQHGANQIFAVGTDLYYVMREQIGTSPSNDLNVYKSSDKVTWTLVDTASSSSIVSQDCPAVLVGTTIYVLGVNVTLGVVKLIIQPFDTTTDTFGSDSSLGPTQGGAGQQLWTLGAFNDGSLLVASTTTAPALTIQTYTPGTDLWSSATSVLAEASKPIIQIHDPANDLQFVFFQKTTTNVLRCLTVDSALSTDDTSVISFTGGSFPIATVGLPIISGGEVLVPFRNFPSGPPELWLARATLSATPTFATETVEDGSGLPGGTFIQGFDQVATGAWALIDVLGTLYAIYAVDNGESPQDADSVSWLYYSEYSGSWGSPAILYTPATPSELLMPYATALADADPIILVGVIDPTTFDDIASLTNFILFGFIRGNTFE